MIAIKTDLKELPSSCRVCGYCVFSAVVGGVDICKLLNKQTILHAESERLCNCPLLVVSEDVVKEEESKTRIVNVTSLEPEPRTVTIITRECDAEEEQEPRKVTIKVQEQDWHEDKVTIITRERDAEEEQEPRKVTIKVQEQDWHGDKHRIKLSDQQNRVFQYEDPKL